MRTLRNQWSDVDDGAPSMHTGTSYSNLVGPLGLGSGCGPRPIGIGKKHREKMDVWNKCMDAARQREAEKKQSKVDARNADTAVNAALAQATMGGGMGTPSQGGGSAERGDGPQVTAEGLSTTAWIGIAAGTVLLLGTAAYFLLRK